MDSGRFDQLARSLSAHASRRGILAGAVGGLLGLPAAAAGRKKHRQQQEHQRHSRRQSHRPEEKGRSKKGRKTAAEGPCGNGSAKANTCKGHGQCCTGYCDPKKDRCRCKKPGKACTESRNCCSGAGQTMECRSGICQTVRAASPPSPTPACAEACAGCCDESGGCQPGTDTAACGTGGETCTDCAGAGPGQTCGGGNGGGTPGVCGCTANDACTPGVCATAQNSCGDEVACTGSCPPCQTCSNGECVEDASQERSCCAGDDGQQWCEAGECTPIPDDARATLGACGGRCDYADFGFQYPASEPICGKTLTCPDCFTCDDPPNNCPSYAYMNGSEGDSFYCSESFGNGICSGSHEECPLPDDQGCDATSHCQFICYGAGA